MSDIKRATFAAAVTRSEDGKRLRAVMSSPKVDRVGDSIVQTGWKLDSFLQNPVMLYQHRSDEPVGVWRDLRIEDGNLTGEMVFHPADINPFADKLRKLFEGGWLKAVSVGFRVLKYEPAPTGGGWLIQEAELLECSAVTIPANTDALIKAAPGARIVPIFGAEPSADERLKGRDLEAISKWVAPATEVRVESVTMTPDEVRKLIADEVAKALGSIKDEQPAAPPADKAPADGTADGTDEDSMAVAIAEVEADNAELASLIAEIEADEA